MGYGLCFTNIDEQVASEIDQLIRSENRLEALKIIQEMGMQAFGGPKPTWKGVKSVDEEESLLI